MTLEELATRCKGTVSLEINPERFGHENRSDYLRHHSDGIPSENLMLATNLYELRFCPDSMLGFYCVYGTSLDDVLKQAHHIIEFDAPKWK